MRSVASRLLGEMKSRETLRVCKWICDMHDCDAMDAIASDDWDILISGGRCTSILAQIYIYVLLSPFPILTPIHLHPPSVICIDLLASLLSHFLGESSSYVIVHHAWLYSVSLFVKEGTSTLSSLAACFLCEPGSRPLNRFLISSCVYQTRPDQKQKQKRVNAMHCNQLLLFPIPKVSVMDSLTIPLLHSKKATRRYWHCSGSSLMCSVMHSLGVWPCRRTQSVRMTQSTNSERRLEHDMILSCPVVSYH